MSPERAPGSGAQQVRDLPLVVLQPGDSLDKALRVLRERVDRAGIIRDLRRHLSAESPGVSRRRKVRLARIRARQRERRAARAERD